MSEHSFRSPFLSSANIVKINRKHELQNIKSVLLEESVENLNIKENGVYVDALRDRFPLR